jgi:carbamoylphosphate synthase large subunit
MGLTWGPQEHIEQAGVHSGDSACSIPTQTVSANANATMREWTKAIAKELKVVGLINIQYAIQDDLVSFKQVGNGYDWHRVLTSPFIEECLIQ